MREIKLRAWDIKGNQYWGATEGDWKIELHDGLTPGLFIFNYECEYGSWIEIEDAVFEEFTGLKDKNGQEIYEGDIVRRELSRPWEIKHFGQVITGVVKYLDDSYWIDFDVGATNLFCEIDPIEIIGNIHENPELLNKKEEEQ